MSSWPPGVRRRRPGCYRSGRATCSRHPCSSALAPLRLAVKGQPEPQRPIEPQLSGALGDRPALTLVGHGPAVAVTALGEAQPVDEDRGIKLAVTLVEDREIQHMSAGRDSRRGPQDARGAVVSGALGAS